MNPVKDWLELSAFLGFANYYSDFLPDFVKLTAELNTVKTKCVIKWNENMINDFQKVKKLFSGGQCRAAPDLSENALLFVLTIDLSHFSPSLPSTVLQSPLYSAPVSPLRCSSLPSTELGV